MSMLKASRSVYLAASDFINLAHNELKQINFIYMIRTMEFIPRTAL